MPSSAAQDLRSPRASTRRVLAHPYGSVSTPLDVEIHAQLLAQAPEFRVLLCGYRSRVCLNHRARKRDGSLHRFCEDHRQRANETQKKWVQRRFPRARDPGALAMCTDEATATIQRLESFEQLLASFPGCEPSSVPVDATATSATSLESNVERGCSPVPFATVNDTLEATCIEDDVLWQTLVLADLEEVVEYSF